MQSAQTCCERFLGPPGWRCCDSLSEYCRLKDAVELASGQLLSSLVLTSSMGESVPVIAVTEVCEEVHSATNSEMKQSGSNS